MATVVFPPVTYQLSHPAVKLAIIFLGVLQGSPPPAQPLVHLCTPVSFVAPLADPLPLEFLPGTSGKERVAKKLGGLLPRKE